MFCKTHPSWLLLARCWPADLRTNSPLVFWSMYIVHVFVFLDCCYFYLGVPNQHACGEALTLEKHAPGFLAYLVDVYRFNEESTNKQWHHADNSELNDSWTPHENSPDIMHPGSPMRMLGFWDDGCAHLMQESLKPWDSIMWAQRCFVKLTRPDCGLLVVGPLTSEQTRL